MITGQVDEKLIPYRQKEGLNYSSIKVFDDDGVGVFYDQFILGNKKEKKSTALLIGNIVDDIILSHQGDLTSFYQHFDEKYVKFEGDKGSGQVFVLVDTLFDSLMETAVDGRVTADFETCFREAFDKVQAGGKYKGKTWEKGLEDFNANGKAYFDKKMEAIGKDVVDMKTLAVAEKTANALLTDEFTSTLLRGEGNPVMPKVVIEFEYLGVKCKVEVDMIELNHEEQTIQPIDLKCVYDNEDFNYSYIKYKYYLQAGFYTKAIEAWAKKEDMEDYLILPFKFVVGDTSVNNRRPLIYTLDGQDIINAITGFKLRGYNYRGVHELVEEIKWHMDNDIWNCSREAIENDGHLLLSINYDK
jgi:hypothetical protein